MYIHVWLKQTNLGLCSIIVQTMEENNKLQNVYAMWINNSMQKSMWKMWWKKSYHCTLYACVVIPFLNINLFITRYLNEIKIENVKLKYFTYNDI